MIDLIQIAKLHNDFEATNMTPNEEIQETIRARLGSIRRKAGLKAKNFDATLDKVGARAVDIARKSKREAARRLIAFVKAEDDAPEEHE